MPISEYNLFDEWTGDLITSTVRKKPRLRGDYIVFYKKALVSLVDVVPNLATFRIYMYLCGKQTFETYVMTTPKAIADKLNLSIKTVRESLKWLERSNYIMRSKLEGNYAILINPSVSNKGAGSAIKRHEEWQVQRTARGIAIDLSNKEEGDTID